MRPFGVPGIIAGTVSAAAVLCAVALAVGSGSNTPAKTVASHTMAASPTPTSYAVAQVSDPPPSPMDDWCNGTGYSDYQAVQSDLTQMRTDIGNGLDGTAENSDAATLSSDANAAIGNPPPVSKSDKLNYVMYMGAISFAAIDLQSGNVSAATTAMQGAAKYSDGVNAVVSTCG